jgi:hypothetical protein
MESKRVNISHTKMAVKPRGDIISDENARINAINSIWDKLRKNNVKIETIVQRCQEIDTNNDEVIHRDDLIDAIEEFLPDSYISKREFHYLVGSLSQNKGHRVQYMKLLTVFNIVKHTNGESENWIDEPKKYSNIYNENSVGEFLHRQACPAEVRNYEILLNCLERYERETGLNIIIKDTGFVIPCGPDLKATLQFHTK